MAAEQEELKGIVARQQELMMEMQESMKAMARELEKVKREQEVQGKKVSLLVKKHNPSSSKRRTEDPSYAAESNSEDEEPSRGKYIEDTLINQKTVGLISRSAHHSRSQATSNHHSRESKQRTSSKRSGAGRHHPEDSELSEYDPSEQERSKYSEKCSEMMVRLQVLLEERVGMR